MHESMDYCILLFFRYRSTIIFLPNGLPYLQMCFKYFSHTLEESALNVMLTYR